MDAFRHELVETIEIALVELREIAQPHEMASLSELRLDATEAEDEMQLRAIAEQVKGLIDFCEGRRRSSLGMRLDLRGRRV